ncbi:DUF2721 domain-containing protein [Aureimonas jatrophae]|uniref:DUF2721 domain-containing protein n=1 Tax=Aureimonas jatrophae TaxID=1166073 RepID=A0A1H0KCA0_9HYPH|nr:DUF2721 domain-containing protein [Aureimonas jatrophae]MBB3951052.1 hypothetical protein [Aureimonas jatrophae]SDO53410.1 Protein of unknown function [Aureimonas jatrophae]
MIDAASVSNVVETIRIAVTPVFLLTGIGALLGVMTGRLSRIMDRAHQLENDPDPTSGNRRLEMDLTYTRMKLIKLAVLLSVVSVFVVCLVIALLFVSTLVGLHIDIAVALAFIVSMLLLMAGLLCFLIEVTLALRLLGKPRDH